MSTWREHSRTVLDTIIALHRRIDVRHEQATKDMAYMWYVMTINGDKCLIFQATESYFEPKVKNPIYSFISIVLYVLEITFDHLVQTPNRGRWCDHWEIHMSHLKHTFCIALCEPSNTSNLQNVTRMLSSGDLRSQSCRSIVCRSSNFHDKATKIGSRQWNAENYSRRQFQEVDLVEGWLQGGSYF